MSASTGIFAVSFIEDSTATILGRVTSRAGSGAAVGKPGDGNWIRQADVSAITCKVFDVDGADPYTAISTPTVTISSAILDSPVTANTLWTEDSYGYNFVFDLPVAAVPTGGHSVDVEFKFTLTDGTVFHAVYRGQIQPIRGS